MGGPVGRRARGIAHPAYGDLYFARILSRTHGYRAEQAARKTDFETIEECKRSEPVGRITGASLWSTLGDQPDNWHRGKLVGKAGRCDCHLRRRIDLQLDP
jgi:hypothetical protein